RRAGGRGGNGMRKRCARKVFLGAVVGRDLFAHLGAPAPHGDRSTGIGEHGSKCRPPRSGAQNGGAQGRLGIHETRSPRLVSHVPWGGSSCRRWATSCVRWVRIRSVATRWSSGSRVPDWYARLG